MATTDAAGATAFPHVFREREACTFHGTPMTVKNTFITIAAEESPGLRAGLRLKRRSDPSVYSATGRPSSESLVRVRVPSTVDEEEKASQSPGGRLLWSEEPVEEDEEEDLDAAAVGAIPTGEREIGCWAPTAEDCELRSYGSITTCDDRRPTLPEDSDDEHRTTVMIRGLPETMSRATLEDLLNREGFNGCYDFIYVPADLVTGLCFCHAFINLVSPEEARRFRRHFSGFTRWPVESDKEGAVDWSEALQGLDELVSRYRNSPLMHKTVPIGLRPAMFSRGQRVAFPHPTVSLKAPRARRSGQKRKPPRTERPPSPTAALHHAGSGASCRTPWNGQAR